MIKMAKMQWVFVIACSIAISTVLEILASAEICRGWNNDDNDNAHNLSIRSIILTGDNKNTNYKGRPIEWNLIARMMTLGDDDNDDDGGGKKYYDHNNSSNH